MIFRQSLKSSQSCSAILPLSSTDPAQRTVAQSWCLHLFSPLLLGRTGRHVKRPELSVRTSLPLQSVQDLLNKTNGAKSCVYSDSPLLAESRKENHRRQQRQREPHRRETCFHVSQVEKGTPRPGHHAKPQEETGHISQLRPKS